MAASRPFARITEHPGASQDNAQADPRLLGQLHDTAARQDGIVKILLGLICIVSSLGMVAMALLGLHQLLHRHELKLWAFIIGAPGLLLCLAGSILMVWGLAKALSGRGHG